MVSVKNSTFELRPYQEIGVEFLRQKKRAMLLDWPGLGKTAQAAFAAETPTLIVCPNYLVGQWVEWLEGKDPKSLERNHGEIIPNVEGTIIAATGIREERIAALESGADWIVTNVEMLTNYEHFDVNKSKWSRRFRTMVFDESHHLKSHIGMRAKIAVKMAQHCEYVFLLTGTPVKREIDDLFMQFRIVQPDIFKSYWRFVNTFCITEQSYFGTEIRGAKKSMLPELQRILEILSLGRGYAEVGRELPPMPDPIYIPIKLTGEIQKIYNQAIDYWRIEDEIGNVSFTNYMQIMHVLRQHLTGKLKADIVKDLMEDVDQKTVIFSWYQNTAEAIHLAIPDSVLITGQIKDPEERRRLAQGSKHVSATISSLSEGVDLSDARNVIFAETDWTPGSNYQALSRVRRERIGGDNSEPVILYYIYVEDTIDEIILNTSEGRARTVAEIVKESLYL